MISHSPDLTLQFIVPENRPITIPIRKILFHKFHADEVLAGISFGEITGISRKNLFEFLFVGTPGYQVTNNVIKHIDHKDILLQNEMKPRMP